MRVPSYMESAIEAVTWVNDAEQEVQYYSVFQINVVAIADATETGRISHSSCSISIRSTRRALITTTEESATAVGEITKAAENMRGSHYRARIVHSIGDQNLCK